MRQCGRCSGVFDDAVEICPHDDSALPAPDPLLGRTLNDAYRVDAFLGRGGMAAVYRATQLSLDRSVAIKLVRTDGPPDAVAAERFKREALTVARLKHPNIVTIFDFGVAPDFGAFLAMEYLEGESLRTEMERRRQYPLEEAIDLMRKVASAVSAAHAAGIVHRDLKPENIFLESATGTRMVKVLDFGIAKLRDDLDVTGTLTAHGELVGSPAYMSPEQCEGEQLDARSDVYSLGCMLFEMLSGRPPFLSRSLPALLMKHVSEAPVSLASLGVPVTPAVEGAVERALAKRADGRFASATEFAEALTGTVVETAATLSVRVTRNDPGRPTQVAAHAVPNNLPHPVTALFGHARRIGQLVDGLAKARMTTVAGPAGVGKTRIALAAAREVFDEHPDGVWLVELAPIADPAHVASAVAKVVGVREEPARSVEDALEEALATSRTLLVMDNCEHVVDAASGLVARLLRSTASLRVLATSREPLGIDGERVHVLQTLEVPDDESAAGQSDAVRLFVDRARLAKPGFAPSEAAMKTIAMICRRLDGMPLAIELAAARVRMISPDQILARLDDRFALLSTQGRPGEPRQQTLRAALDWSYALLADEERELLDALSVFAGSFSLEGAESVAPAREGSCDVLDGLTRLVIKSLVTVEDEGDEVRHRLLESIRQYAREKLGESDREPETLARRHEWAVDLSARFTGAFNTPDRTALLHRIDVEYDNLRAALRWCLRESPDARRGVALVHALWRYWVARGYWTEGLGYVREALALEGDAAPEMLADVQRGGADLAYSMGYLEDSERYLVEALRVYGEIGDRRGEAIVLQRLGDVAQCLGRTEEAHVHCERSAEIAREVGDRLCLVLALSALGVVAMDGGEYDRATELFEETLEASREIEYQRGVCAALHNLGDIAERLGELDRAESMLGECHAVALEMSDIRMTAYTVGVLGSVARRRGDDETAKSRLGEALRMHGEVRDRVGVVSSVEVLAAVLAGQGQGEDAIELLGAASALREAIQLPLPPAEKALVDETLAAARAALAPDAAGRAFARGRRLSPDATLARALAILAARAPAALPGCPADRGRT